MLPTQIIADEINVLYPDFEVFIGSIDEDAINNTKTTQVLLSESDLDNTSFGDGTFNSIHVGVDIQIFYGSNFDDDMILTEIRLMKHLENSGWKITDSQPHYLDITQTDYQQTIKNITVNKIMTFEEIGYNG